MRVAGAPLFQKAFGRFGRGVTLESRDAENLSSPGNFGSRDLATVPNRPIRNLVAAVSPEVA
jgi:hypothetical protein